MAFKSSILRLMSILFLAADSAPHFTGYRENYIEDLCLFRESLQYVLEETGPGSVIKIKAATYSRSTNDRNCTIVISPAVGSGVILKIDSMPSLNSHQLSQCSDYIQVFNDGGNLTKLCGFLNESSMFVTKGKIELHYYTSPKTAFIPGVGFVLLATSYKRGDEGFCDENHFYCFTGECIWKGFKCDRRENCPYASDEKAFCGDIGISTTKPSKRDHIYEIPNTPLPLGDLSKGSPWTIVTVVVCLLIILLLWPLMPFFRYLCSLPRCQRIRHYLDDTSFARSVIARQSRVTPSAPLHSFVAGDYVVVAPPSAPGYSLVNCDDDVQAMNSVLASGFSGENEIKVDQPATDLPPSYETIMCRK